MKRSEYLMDVVVIRLFLIFFLIFYHSFAIYSGGWGTPFVGFNNDIPSYFWMGHLSHAFQLEAMVFISGLLLGYSVAKYPERLCFDSCVTKKVKRVLLPSVLFSIVYYLMFYDLGAPWYVIIYKILNGCGHLWFLPMIFWCFVVCYLIAKFTPPHWQGKCLLLISILINIFAYDHIPFGIGQMMTYFVFFYLGYALKRNLMSMRMMKVWESVILILLYLVITVVSLYVKNIPTSGLIEKGTLVVAMRTLHFLGAMCMVLAIFSLANNPWLQERIKKYDFLITMSGYCYGVYIYHQFILRFLYYDTPLTHCVSAEVLPWIGLGVTLVLSLLFCHLTLKTRFGRYLIG